MKKESRGRKAIVNTIVGLSYELVALICGLVITRLILSNFGSAYNGITSSITQFISCISLLRAGIGGVTRAALYKPLAENDTEGISIIIGQTERFMQKVAMIFLFAIILFACLYPFLISDEFDWLFSSSLILIISLTTFAQYFFGITYQLLLEADQKLWIVSFVNGVGLIANAIISAILIYLSDSIHVVKLGSSFVFVLSSVFLYLYARKKYGIIKTKETKENKLIQKWDALAHEVAHFANTNTDVIILTFFTSLSTISVYTIYALVTLNLRKTIKNFTLSFGSSFGNMKAMGQNELIESNFRLFEVIVFSVVSILFSTTLPMITPFVLLYTKGVYDVDYNQPIFGLIMVLVGVFDCTRIPYETVVKSFGYYKQTRNGAIFEAVFHIILSVVLTYKFGLIGVAIGGMFAIAYRSYQFVCFLSKKIIHRKLSIYITHILFTLIIMFICTCLYRVLFQAASDVNTWILQTLFIFVISSLLTGLKNIFLYKKESLILYNKIKSYRHE